MTGALALEPAGEGLDRLAPDGPLPALGLDIDDIQSESGPWAAARLPQPGDGLGPAGTERDASQGLGESESAPVEAAAPPAAVT